MTLVGQPPPSPVLKQGLDLLAQGKADEGEHVVKKAAQHAKAKHGSGSHPLALAYADLARFHLRQGRLERAANEFEHAAKGPLPAEEEHRKDRLAMLFGYGAAVGELGRLAEAEKVLRRCLAFARNVHGGQSAGAAVALVPLADVRLMAGDVAEATNLAAEAYDTLWRLGDAQITLAFGTRAEVMKAAGKGGNPFADLGDLPDDLAAAAVATTLNRAGKGDPGHVRAVLADLLGFVEKRFGDGHPVTCDTLAAVAHHEADAGDEADAKVRKTAVRKSVWSYAVRRVPAGLLADLQVGFEPDGTVHLAPHLTRDPAPAEAAQIEAVLGEAVDDLYARPAIRP